MEFVGKEHRPWVGRPPQDGLVVVVPGKDAVPVGFEQPFWSQVAPDGEQPSGDAKSTGGKRRSDGFALSLNMMATQCTRREKATVSRRLLKNSVYTQNADRIFRGRRCQNSRRMLKKAVRQGRSE